MVRHFQHSGPIEHITIGCSHTRMHHLSVPDRWPVLVYNDTGIYFDHHQFSKVGAGLSVLYARAQRKLKEMNLVGKIKTVIIQKPKAIRCPWWGDITGDGYPNGMGCLSGRREADKRYRSSKEKKKIADTIYAVDLEILKKFVDLFPSARIAYYYYWINDIQCQLHYPELSEVNQKLGTAVEGLMTNLGQLIDSHDVPGVYDDEGDLVFDTRKICEAGWILGHKDLHPGITYSSLVAQKILEWL